MPDNGYITGAAGGDGVVFLRMSDAAAAGGTINSATSTTTNVGGSGETVIKFLANGSFVAGSY